MFIDGEVVTLKPARDEQVSEDNPVKLSLDLDGKNSEAVNMSEIRIGVGENVPTKMKLQVLTDEGETLEFDVDDTTSGITDIHLFTDEVLDGTIRVDLGKQIAVKKVTIIVTETSSTDSLVDIAKVEFLNNVKMETKEPENFYTPEHVKIDSSKSEQLTISFDSVPNVTGYEIKIVGPKMESGVTFQTTYTTFTIEDLKNYATYKIYVQSANQEWRSGWNKEPYIGIPVATRKPPKVDMVKATGGISQIDFSWKDMDDTKSYNIYYREVGKDKYEVIKNISGTSYTLRGLKPLTTYEAYITGNNDLGEGEASLTVSAKTLKEEATIVPQYSLINDYNSNLRRTNHIEDVRYSVGTMTNDDPLSIVDDNYKTYWHLEDWQISAHYPENGFNTGTPVIILDDVYKMDEFVITVPDDYTASFKTGGLNSNDVKVHYWEEAQDKYDNTERKDVRGTLTTKYDENNRKYYLLKLDEPISAKAVAFGLTTVASIKDIRIDEVKFYKYDSLVDDVQDLFVDDLRIELTSNYQNTNKPVDQELIDSLRKRAEIKDHDEYNPYYDSILRDLEYAEKLLNDENIDDIIELNPNISNSLNGNLGFAMQINDYQPLGIVVRPGIDKTLTIYVGSNGKDGEYVNAEVVFTQYHAEASAWNNGGYRLKKGQNIIEIPTIGSDTLERGGSVYIRFTSRPSSDNIIKIRVSGGTKIPVLDTTLLETEEEKKSAVENYISELNTYVSSLEKVYADNNDHFIAGTSVLDSTEIVTKYGLWSVSATAVKNAIDSIQDNKVDRLYESTEAFTEMMEMFYRHKGLSEYSTDINNQIPKSRINIRYMRMFDGAFMYAGGYHIGIEYGSIAGLIQARKNSSDSTGYFGWGISHEIGHQINQGNLVYAEVTNNVYSLLAQTSNDSDKSRLESSNIYEKIYDKVTSHTLGRAQNVFVQLGMYWQLHLAYDDNKTFDDTDSIFARINNLSRTYENVNKYDKDQLLILLASKAAKKDLTDYFEIWGLKASDTLKEEINSLGLEKETRPIYYLNDLARRYRLTINTKASISNISASIKDTNSIDKRVTISFSVDKDSDKILGYEILRNNESIDFVEGDVNTFTDNIGAVNNRAFTYTVVAYDYLLNKVGEITLDEVKIAHDGSVKKGTFSIESNVSEKNENVDFEDDEMDYSKLKVNNLIDGDILTGFNGTEKVKTLVSGTVPKVSIDSGNAYVIINLNTKLSLSGIKYRALIDEDGNLNANTIKDYKIYVSSDKVNWIEARKGTFELTKENPEQTVYFMKSGTTSESQLYTYNDISYIKIEAVNKMSLSGSEIDIIAPPGDNVDISITSDGSATIGKLEEDYCYLTDGCKEIDENGDTVGLIKAGSVVFKGTYMGSPSFNILTIADAFDTKKIYGGYQLIFAEVEDNMEVYDVAEGTWLYVMDKDTYEKMVLDNLSIRVYMYRVNDAITKEGQRITSTSKAITKLVPYDELNYMTLTSSEVSN